MATNSWPSDTPDWLLEELETLQEEVLERIAKAVDPQELARNAGALKMVRHIEERGRLRAVEENAARQELLAKMGERKDATQ